MSSGALRSSGLLAAFATAFEHRVLRFPAVYLLIPAYSVPGKIPGGTLLSRSLNPGGRGRIRTFVARKERQIYSLLVLATHPPVPKNHLGRELRVPNLILQQLAAIPCKNTKRTRVKRHQPVHFSSRNSFRPRSPAIFLVELAEGIEPPTL